MNYEFIDIRQRHYITFLRCLKRFQPDEWAEIDDLPAEVYMDVLVRAAIEAGWFGDSLTIEQLDDMAPKDTDEIAIAVAGVYREVKTPDPN